MSKQKIASVPNCYICGSRSEIIEVAPEDVCRLSYISYWKTPVRKRSAFYAQCTHCARRSLLRNYRARAITDWFARKKYWPFKKPVQATGLPEKGSVIEIVQFGDNPSAVPNITLAYSLGYRYGSPEDGPLQTCLCKKPDGDFTHAMLAYLWRYVGTKHWYR